MEKKAGLVLLGTAMVDWQILVPLLKDSSNEHIHNQSENDDYIDSSWLPEKIGALVGPEHRQLLIPDAQESLVDMDSLVHDQNSDVHFLMFFEDPQSRVCRAMEAGTEPEQALEEWIVSARRLLTIQKQNRKRATVVHWNSMLEDLRNLFVRLESMLGAHSTVPEKLPGPADPVLQAIAAQLVRQSDEAVRLHAEFTAAAQYIMNNQLRQKIHANEAFRLYQQQTMAALTQSEQSRIAELEAVKAEHEKTFDEMLTELHRTQEELEKYYLLHKKEKQRAEDFKAKNKRNEALKQKYRKRLDYAIHSKSWKITAPVRVFIRLLRGKPIRKKAKKQTGREKS